MTRDAVPLTGKNLLMTVENTVAGANQLGTNPQTHKPYSSSISLLIELFGPLNHLPYTTILSAVFNKVLSDDIRRYPDFP